MPTPPTAGNRHVLALAAPPPCLQTSGTSARPRLERPFPLWHRPLRSPLPRLQRLLHVQANPLEETDGGAEDGAQQNSMMDDIMAMCKEEGIAYVFADDVEDEEDWDDILDDMDDPWMREPAPAPEIEQQLAEEAAVAEKQLEPAASAYSADGGFRVIGVADVSDIIDGKQDAFRASSCTFLDVRSSMEYSIGHIPGSVNIPVKQLTREAVAGFEGNSVVVVGSGDDRSKQAVVRLTKVYGFTDVMHFEGGHTAWQERTS